MANLFWIRLAPFGLLSKIQPPIDQNLAKRKAKNKTRIERRMWHFHNPMIQGYSQHKICFSISRFYVGRKWSDQNGSASIKTGPSKNYGTDHKFQINCNPKAINSGHYHYRTIWNFHRYQLLVHQIFKLRAQLRNKAFYENMDDFFKVIAGDLTKFEADF